jgi:hypothetical protein
MKRTLSLLGLAFLTLAALSAHALTVTPLPGVSPQAAAQSAFFVVPPAVRVTDSANQPVAGASVHFAVVPMDPSHGAVFFPGPDFGLGNEYDTTTGPDGVATTGTGPFGYIAGPSGVIATATLEGPLGPQKASVTIPLTVVPGGSASFSVVSGDHQRAAIGTAYGAPWVVQALDANKKPVPYAAVVFYNSDDPTQPGVTFAGTHSIWARADANGVATSPIPVANLVEGKNEGFAATLNFQVNVTSAFFEFANVAPSSGGSGGSDGGCGRQGKGNGDCGNSPEHSDGNGNNGNGKG